MADKWESVLQGLLQAPCVNLDRDSPYVREHYQSLLLLGTLVYFHGPFADILLAPLASNLAFQELVAITGYQLKGTITALLRDLGWASNFFTLLWPKLTLPQPTFPGLNTALGPVKFFPEHTAFFYHLICRGPLQKVPKDQWVEWMSTNYHIELDPKELQDIDLWNMTVPRKEWLDYLCTSLFADFYGICRQSLLENIPTLTPVI